MATEKTSNGNFAKNTRNLSLSVVCSRILGLLRDMLLSAVLGGKVMMGAWTQASSFASIARQILGEGALGQALVPILSQSMKDFGADVTRKKFTTLFIYLTLFLCVLNIFVAVPFYLCADWFENQIWRNAALIFPIVLPYSIFICAVGVMTSYMNMMRVFFLPSLTAILQNVVVIGALYFICPKYEGIQRLRVLSFAVLVAGVLEFLFMLFLLWRQKMTLHFATGVCTDWATLKEVLMIAFPGMLSASVHTLSTVTDRLISGNMSAVVGDVGNYATSALYYSDRLVLLPIGVFAFAFSTVALTEFSRAYADRDFQKFRDMLTMSSRSLLFITIPIAVFMLVFGRPIIRMLFMHGRFGTEELEQTYLALKYYVFAIPAFALLKVVTASFMAQRKVWFPFYVGLGTVVLNIILNLVLMRPLRQGGIALATVVSGYLNIFILLYVLDKTLGNSLPKKESLMFVGKVLLIAVLPIFVTKPLYVFLAGVVNTDFLNGIRYLRSFSVLVKEAVCIGCSCFVYGVFVLALAKALRVQEGAQFLNRVLGKIRRK